MKWPDRRVAFLLLWILPALWWAPLLTGSLPDFMDTVVQIEPYRAVAARQLHQGIVPLWNPHAGAGVPLAANPQVGVWYPPNWLFFAWPHPIANGIGIIFHYWLGGFGLWLLTRRTGCSRPAALLAAVGFQFGSMMISRIALTPHLCSMAWLPWILWAIEETVRRRAPVSGGVLVGALFALQILSGAPQVSFYTALLLPGWWMLRGWPRWRDVLLSGALAAALAFLLAAVQLIPTLEFLGASARNTIGIERLTQQGLGGGTEWRALVGFTGSPLEDTDTINAIGLGLLALLPFALLRRRRRGLALTGLGFGVFFWVLALGALAPFLAKVLPLYGSFHAPRRSLLIWSLLGPFVAAHGAQTVLAMLRRRGRQRWAPALLVLALLPTVPMLPRLERAFADPARFDPAPGDRTELATSRFAMIDPTFRYSHASREPDSGVSLMPNLASRHGLYDAQLYDPLVLDRMAMLRDAACARSGLFYPSHGIYLTDPTSPAWRLLGIQYLVGRWDLFRPGDVIPGAGIDAQALAAQLELVRDDERWPLWRFREPRPLAWVVEVVAPAVSAEEAVALSLREDARRIAFTEEPVYLPRVAAPPSIVAAITPAGGYQIAFPAPTSQEHFLVASGAWMKGWVAETDLGDRIAAIPANGALCGVIVPKGTSTLELRYEPASFRQGLLLNLAGLLVAAALLLRARRQSFSE